jgi:hypothetical protein
LKPGALEAGRQVARVAPHAGAWIETGSGPPLPWWPASPPTRGRGLKRAMRMLNAIEAGSPPTRGRGLKPRSGAALRRRRRVAPHAGAWIETTPATTPRMDMRVAPHAGAWIETVLPAG